MPKQRIDKLFSNLGILSRTACSTAIKSGDISVNGEICRSKDMKIDTETDVVTYKGEKLDIRDFVYYMFNKPAGCITANDDKHAETAFDYIKDKRADLSAVGRLDKDTTGILLITNDGALNHRLLSPKYHVAKTYEAVIEGLLTEEDIERLENGLDIGDDKPTLPAKGRTIKVNGDGTSVAELIITEGRFHQVKRMFEAVGKPVLSLHRSAFGPLTLDPNLKPGDYRELSEDEKRLMEHN